MNSGRDFKQWMSLFTDTIADYNYYIDFIKVYENVEKIKIELNILNSLVGSKDIKGEFFYLLKKYPEVLKCIPILIAVRENEIKAIDSEGTFKYNFVRANQSPEQYAIFMEKTGLFNLISNRIINNIFDYVTGVETGLNSNARKNRGGHLMEKVVESYIEALGIEYYSEMYISEIERKWNLDLSKISNMGKTKKRFDFVLKSKGVVYVFEVNFYASGGSKLNETARSYKMIAEESKNIEGFKFVWITDGLGWLSAAGNLRETFDVLENVYCIKELDDGILRHLIL